MLQFIKKLLSLFYIAIVFLYVSCSEFSSGISGEKKKTSAVLERHIIIAIGSEPRTLDPRLATDAIGMRLVDLLFQPLVRLGPQLELLPGAAKQWSVKGKTYHFTISKSLRFSNGRAIDKQDILFSFKEYQSEQYPFFSAFRIIDTVEVKETEKDWLLSIQLKKQSPKFLKADLPVLKILPRKETLLAKKNVNYQLIGSGPFIVKEKTSRHIILQARLDLPKPFWVQQVTFKIIRDELTRFQKVLTGEIDIVQSDLPAQKIKWFMNKKTNFQVIRGAGLSVTYLLINFKDSCLQQRNVRQALGLSLNREDIITHKLHGLARRAVSLLHPEHFFFNQDLKLTSYDLKEAKRIFKSLTAACRNKTYTLKSSHLKSIVAQAGVLAANIQQAGFNLKTESFEWGTFYSALNRGQFELALLNWTGVVDPDIYRLAFHSGEHPPSGRNRGFYDNKTLDHLLEQGGQVMDRQKRKSFYDKAQTIIQQDMAFIPLWHTEQVVVVKKNIMDYYLSQTGSFYFLLNVKKGIN